MTKLNAIMFHKKMQVTAADLEAVRKYCTFTLYAAAPWDPNDPSGGHKPTDLTLYADSDLMFNCGTMGAIFENMRTLGFTMTMGPLDNAALVTIRGQHLWLARVSAAIVLETDLTKWTWKKWTVLIGALCNFHVGTKSVEELRGMTTRVAAPADLRAEIAALRAKTAELEQQLGDLWRAHTAEFGRIGAKLVWLQANLGLGE